MLESLTPEQLQEEWTLLQVSPQLSRDLTYRKRPVLLVRLKKLILKLKSVPGNGGSHGPHGTLIGSQSFVMIVVRKNVCQNLTRWGPKAK